MIPNSQSAELCQNDVQHWQNQYNIQNPSNNQYGYYENTNIQSQTNDSFNPNAVDFDHYPPQFTRNQDQLNFNQYTDQTQSLNYSSNQNTDTYNHYQQFHGNDANLDPSNSVQTLDRNIKKKNKESFKKIPCHNFKKSRQNRLANDRPSSRNSLASEKDHYIKWYQMLVNYYKQYYPDFQLPDIRSMSHADFGAYCYQFYMQAQKNWSDNMGMMIPNYTQSKQAPYLYRGPHLRVNLFLPGILLLILPTRPADGQPSRLELIAIDDIANDAIANAGIRASELVLQERKEQEIARQFENSAYASSTNASTGGISTQLDDASSLNDLESEQMKARAAKFYADITITWDRVDNDFFPGPLCAKRSLKLDLLAYLKEKSNDIEDRMPIDWESIILFIKFLETMIKNNGALHASEICQLLLEGQEKRQINGGDFSHLVSTSMSFSEAKPQTTPLNKNQSYDSQTNLHYEANMNSTPQNNGQTRIKRSESIASSSLSEIQLNQNAGNLQALLRKLALKTDRSTDNGALEKFRQLLMSGMNVKAIEFACKAKLWGHAFTLAVQLNDPKFPQNDGNLLNKVCKLFIASSIIPTDPIASLYQTLGNEQPQIINSIGFSAGADLNEWRPHVAMLLSAKAYRPALVIDSIEKLGDSLLAKRLTFASHICYLISEQLKFETNSNSETVWNNSSMPLLHNWSRLPGKIWLIGLSKQPGDFDCFNFDKAVEFNGSYRSTSEDYEDIGVYPTECVQFSEIYEYCLKLRLCNSQNFHGTKIINRLKVKENFLFIHLLPYKLAYAIRLLDAGLIEAAYSYLLVCSDALLKFILITDINFSNSPYELSNYPVDLRNFDRNIQINLYQVADIITKLLTKLQSYPDLDWISIMTQIDEDNGFQNLSINQPQEPLILTCLKRIHNSLCKSLEINPMWPQPNDSFNHIEDNFVKMNLNEENPVQFNDVLSLPKEKTQPNISSSHGDPAPTQTPSISTQQNGNFFNPMIPVNQSSFNDYQQNESCTNFDFFANLPAQVPQHQVQRSRNPSTSSHLSGTTSGTISRQQQQRLSFSGSIDENSQSYPASPQSPVGFVSHPLMRVEESVKPKPFSTPSLTHQISPKHKTLAENKTTKPEKPDNVPVTNDSNEKSEHWFGSIISKLKPKSYLPNDSKQSIYYDEKLKRWVDKDDPNGGDDCPLPPPIKPGMSLSLDTNSIVPSSQFANQKTSGNQLTTAPNSKGFAKTRSRYVNVLQDSGQTNTQSPDIPLPP